MSRILCLIVALVCSLSSVSAKDAAFDTFWTDFKSALTKNDKEALSSLTSLPFESYDGKLNKTQFIKYCDKIFPKKTRNCLVKQKPVADNNSYCACCGDEIFIFEKVSGKYLFTSISPND